MQIKNSYRHWWALIVSCLILGAVHAQDDKENKLVEFKGHGQWEVWCIDVRQSGNVECNFNHVLHYKNHPDFRAMIFRFYSDGDQITKMVIDKEWQSSFSRGYFQVDDFEKIDLSDCAKECEAVGEQLMKIVDQFSSGEKATIRFHDYLVQEFEENIPVGGFAEGLQNLIEMQKRY